MTAASNLQPGDCDLGPRNLPGCQPRPLYHYISVESRAAQRRPGQGVLVTDVHTVFALMYQAYGLHAGVSKRSRRDAR